MPAELPDPWEDLNVVSTEHHEALEGAVGSGLTYEDLTDDEVERTQFGTMPKGGRSLYVMGAQWRRIRNVDTDVEVLLRLQRDRLDSGAPVKVSSVVIPFEPGRDLQGTDVRSIPVAALAAAFTRDTQMSIAYLAIAFALGETERPDPLQPLPAPSARDEFTALVALQYLALEKQKDKRSIVQRMSELNPDEDGNPRPASTVQRWITRARKREMLPPHDPQRR